MKCKFNKLLMHLILKMKEMGLMLMRSGKAAFSED